MFEPPDSPEWAKLASAADGDLYGDVAGDARNRTGTIALAWVMRDFKKVQETGDGARYLSTREKLEFICDDKIMRSWLVERYAGRMGAGTVVSMTKSGKRSPVTEKDAAFMKFACAAKPTAP